MFQVVRSKRYSREIVRFSLDEILLSTRTRSACHFWSTITI